MRFAYADPPYPGMAHRYAEEAEADGRVAAEVDHAALIAGLCADYDGWALSTSTVALREVQADAFCFWLFDLLGLEPEDDFDDLFPGSGAVSRCWDRFCNQGRLVG